MKKLSIILVLLMTSVLVMSGCMGNVSKSGPGGISVPSSYQKTTTTQIEEGVTMTQYLVESSDTNQIMSDLKQSALDEGWEIMAEWEGGIAGYDVGVVLEKGNEVLAINTIQSEGETLAMIIKGPKEDTTKIDDETDPSDDDLNDDGDDVQKPPTNDVSGDDLSDVPRYPGSVRVGYSSTEDDVGKMIMIAYLTQDSLEEIKSYYEDQLGLKGWENVYSMTQTVDGDQNIFITADTPDKYVYVEAGSDSGYEDYEEIVIYYEEDA